MKVSTRVVQLVVVCLLVVGFCMGVVSPILAGKPDGWKTTSVSPSEAFGGSVPSISYANGRYAIAFDDTRDSNSEIYLSLLTSGGHKKGVDIRITNDSGNSREPTVIWNGQSFGIFWYDNPTGETRGIYYASISKKGIVLVGPTRVNHPTADGVHPSAVWDESSGLYGLVWWDSRIGGTYFAQVNPDGSVVTETPVSTLGPSGYYKPLITTFSEGYGIVWGEWVSCASGMCPEMVFAQVDLAGSKIGSDSVVTAYGATRPKSIVWNGSEYGVLVGRGHYAHLQRVTTSGTLVAPSVDLGYIMMSNAKMIWNGSNYAVTWIDSRWITPETPDNSEIAFQTFDSRGTPVGEVVRVSNHDGAAWNSSTPVWNGHSYAVVWTENLYEPTQAVFFAQGR